ncbi:PIN-like domain-containing protein [Bacillus wiedmannii]|uniref:PIN-like domain-containing protein n=1 Tax=Bacillus wiedmannii TaxID=1890302 RepID=UPI000BFC1978|nr:PIN domain-containing protein [Bacillus wiedmannii]PHB61677.1 hypothetical protein COE87_18620 [Bacillus wiedmannii]
MESYEKYFIYQPDLKNLYEEEAVIVPDTNFLLMAYQWRNVTTDEVKKVLEGLNNTNRLKIPEQVLYEFSKNRQTILLEQIAMIDNELNKVQNPQKEIKIFMPTAEGSEEIIDAQSKSEILSTALQEYKNSLKKVKEKIVALTTHDEYFEFIKELCQGSFLPYSKDKDTLREEGLRRISLGIKPGTNEKKIDPTGDYIIWSEIMTLKQHVIFVSNDQKKDWVYKSNNSKPLGVDQTLLSEFYSKTNGKHFLHVGPKEFIKFLVPKLEKAVEEDLDRTNDGKSIPGFMFFNASPEKEEFWEIYLNRVPTIEDIKAVEEIVISAGFTERPLVLFSYENGKANTIVVSSYGMEGDMANLISNKIQVHFSNDLKLLLHPNVMAQQFN